MVGIRMMIRTRVRPGLDQGEREGEGQRSGVKRRDGVVKLGHAKRLREKK